MYVAQPIEWTDHGVVMLDQRRLPTEEVHYTYTDYQRSRRRHQRHGHSRRAGHRRRRRDGRRARRAALEAQIRRRTAPEFDEICDRPRENAPHRRRSLLGDRPHESEASPPRRANFRPRKIRAAMIAEAQASSSREESHRRSDRPLRRRTHAARTASVMTQCNAGALATGGIGTALGVIRVAVEAGQKTSRPRSRNAPVSARRAPHRLGTAPGRHPAHAHHRQHGRPLPEDRQGRRGRHRRRPHRRAMATPPTKSARIRSPCSRKKITSRSTSPRRSRLSICRSRTATTFRSKSAPPHEVTHIKDIRIAPDVQAAHPGLRRDSRALHHRHHHRTRRRPRALH